MAIATKTQTVQKRPMRRVWKVPTSKAFWLWLAVSVVLYIGIYAWYLLAVKTEPFVGPFRDPLRLFGVIAFVMVLGTGAYSLRRRFVRGLPGMARGWLWMHTWLGITSLLIVLLHENYAHILSNYCGNLGCFTQSYFGTSALFALIFLVISGVVGRLLDMWQARVIARDASANGVGIAQALEERIVVLEYTVERLSAGKSEPFKDYCLQALENTTGDRKGPHSIHGVLPSLQTQEQAAFQRAQEILIEYARLRGSLRRQRRARLIFRTWRYVHMSLAVVALLIIIYHALFELLTSVLGVRFG